MRLNHHYQAVSYFMKKKYYDFKSNKDKFLPYQFGSRDTLDRSKEERTHIIACIKNTKWA